MDEPFPVYIGPQAAAEAARFATERGLHRVTLLADENTQIALGERAQQALAGAGHVVRPCVLRGPEVIADAARILEVLVAADTAPDAYVAVGSGTITDIARFVSHRTGVPFLSLPTAPSVDGYASVSAPLVIGRYKRTVGAQGPLAIFADLPTLCAAPHAMIAAGFGDMLGKFTSLADWQLSRLAWGDRYDEAVAARTRDALERTVRSAADIGAARPEGIRDLMRALIDSGLAMLAFNDSRPASGSEHHLSHFWEMRLLLAGRPAILHGAKVGVGCLRVGRWFAAIAALDRDAARERLASTPPPRRDDEIAGIRAVYGPAAEQIIASHAAFLDGTPTQHAELCTRLVDQWDKVVRICRSVPPVGDLASLLAQVGGPTQPAGLGIDDAEADLAERFAHYLRPRFTVLKLARLLGML